MIHADSHALGVLVMFDARHHARDGGVVVADALWRQPCEVSGDLHGEEGAVRGIWVDRVGCVVWHGDLLWEDEVVEVLCAVVEVADLGDWVGLHAVEAHGAGCGALAAVSVTGQQCRLMSDGQGR